MRKLISSFTALLVAATCWLPLAAAPLAAAVSVPTVWVDDDWAGSSHGDTVGGDKTYGVDAFASIQEAIDGTTGPATIYVAAGTYGGTINITGRSGISLIGEGAGATMVVPTSTLTWDVPGYSTRLVAVRVVDSTDISLSQFTFDWNLIRGTGARAGFLYWNSTGSISHNTIQNLSYSDTSGGYYEQNCVIRAPGYTLDARAAVVVSDNTFIDVGRQGVVAYDYVDVTVENNTFYKTTDDFGYAIEISSLAVGSLTGNVIYGYDTAAASDGSESAGIYVHNAFTGPAYLNITEPTPKAVLVQGNEVYDCQAALHIGNEWNGLGGDVDIAVAVVDNYFHDNTYSPWGTIRIADEDKENGSSVTVTLQGNVVIGSGEIGYSIYTMGDGEVSVSVAGDTITGHDTGILVADYAADGVTSQSSYAVDVTGCDLSGNSSYGVDNRLSGVTVTATSNWWGSASGPCHGGNLFNDYLQGVCVSGELTYVPWLDAAPPSGVDFAPVTTDTGGSYCSIQAAVDAATPGGTVSVAAGEFKESIVIGKPLTLYGAQAGVDARDRSGPETVINGQESTDYVVRITGASAHDVVVDGFTITNPEQARTIAEGFKVHGSEAENYNITLRNNIVEQIGDPTVTRSFGVFGIHIYNCRDVLVERSLVRDILCATTSPNWNGTSGFWLWGDGGENKRAYRVTIRDNHVENCTTYGIGLSMAVVDTVIERNTVALGTSVPGTSWSRSGIRVAPESSTYGIIIRDNDVVDCSAPGWTAPGQTGDTTAGIRVQNFPATGGTQVLDNRVSGGNFGLDIYWYDAYSMGAQNVTVTGNTFVGNAVGMRVGSGCTGLLVTGNAFSGNTMALSRLGSVPMTATGNWWGSASGPAHTGNTYNVTAQGDAVSDNVTFVPWLDAAPPGGVSFAPVTTSGGGSFSSIQAAVEAASTDDTVMLAPGTFTEQVVIQKDLSLFGAGRDLTTIESPDTTALVTTPGHGTTRAVVSISSPGAPGSPPVAATVTAAVADLTIDGRGQAPSSGYFYGLHFYHANGSLTGSTVTRIRQSTLGGVQGVIAVMANHYWDTWVPMAVSFSDNVITDYQKGGIAVNEWGVTATITGNTVTGYGPTGVTAQNGIQVGYGASAVVSGNRVSGNSYTGDGWSASGILVVGNSLDETAHPVDGTTVTRNIVTANDVGIDYSPDNYYGYGQARGSAQYNQVYGNGDGVVNACDGYLLDATGNWWGHASGPQHATNLGGLGDPVSDNVLFDPWDGGTVSLSAPTAAPIGATRTVSACLTLADGTRIDVPLEVSFTSTHGTITSPVTTTDGVAETEWVTGGATGLARIGAEIAGAYGEAGVSLYTSTPPPPPPPPVTGSTGGFSQDSESGVVTVIVPDDVCGEPIVLSIVPSVSSPSTGGNPCLGVYDIEMSLAADGSGVHELDRSLTIVFHFTPESLAAAGITDPSQLRIWYWDTTAAPPCWVALPTIVDLVAGTASVTIDHLTTFAAMVDPGFPALPDVAGHWAETDILRLASLGAVSGFEDGSFRPELAVTRAQFAKFLAVSLGLAEGTALPGEFSDGTAVPAWARPYVAACVREGILTGSNGWLRPNDTITRAEAAVMIIRALGIVPSASSAQQVLAFSDAASIPDWAAAYVGEAVARGIMTGLPGNVFDASGTLTRAQAVTILSRVIDL